MTFKSNDLASLVKFIIHASPLTSKTGPHEHFIWRSLLHFSYRQMLVLGFIISTTTPTFITGFCNKYYFMMSKHYNSVDSLEKRWNMRSFQQTAVWKLQCWLKAPHISAFLQTISATMMTTDMSGRWRTLTFFLTFFIINFPVFLY